MLLTFLALALSTQQAPPAAASPPAKPRMQCRANVDTGTRIGRKRVCASDRDWDNARQEQIDSMAQDRARSERSRPCTGIPCRR